jgi:hypothetical protein
MDEADLSDERIALELSFQLAAVRNRSSLAYVGQCYSCGEGTPAGNNFCDSDCRADYERIKRMEQINGKN